MSWPENNINEFDTLLTGMGITSDKPNMNSLKIDNQSKKLYYMNNYNAGAGINGTNTASKLQYNANGLVGQSVNCGLIQIIDIQNNNILQSLNNPTFINILNLPPSDTFTNNYPVFRYIFKTFYSICIDKNAEILYIYIQQHDVNQRNNNNCTDTMNNLIVSINLNNIVSITNSFTFMGRTINAQVYNYNCTIINTISNTGYILIPEVYLLNSGSYLYLIESTNTIITPLHI